MAAVVNIPIESNVNRESGTNTSNTATTIDPSPFPTDNNNDPQPDNIERASLLHDDGDNRHSNSIMMTGGHSEEPVFDLNDEPRSSRSLLLCFVVLPAMFGFLLYGNYYHPIPFLKGGQPSAYKNLPTYMFNDTVAPTILISIDAFRFDYLDRTKNNDGVTYLAPTLRALAKRGVYAKTGMQPVMPSITFPNHWSLVTGLYPESHNIVGNTMYSEELKTWFHHSGSDPHWWSGEPIWQTLQRTPRKIRFDNGTISTVSSPYSKGNKNEVMNYTTGCVFWVGSDVKKHLPDAYWKYDKSVSYNRRVDRVVDLLRGRAADLGIGRAAQFVALYFESVDSAGHKAGPNSELVNTEISRVDKAIERLIQRVNETITIPVNYIVVSDHGMSEISSERVIDLDKSLPHGTTQDITVTPMGLWLNMTETPQSIVNQMSKEFAKTQNAKAMLKQNLPDRWHLKNSRYITPVVSIADIGWTVTYPHQNLVPGASERFVTVSEKNSISTAQKAKTKPIIRGTHGFDNTERDMQATFIAAGPAFKTGGLEVSGFRNIDLYPLLCAIFSATPAPNNGSLEISQSSILAASTS